MSAVRNILLKPKLSKPDIIQLLSATEKDDHDLLLKEADSVKEKIFGKKVYLRGIIEFSNECIKNCLYCGIRSENKMIKRYSLSDDEILNTVCIAYENKINSIVLQAGEQNNKEFTERIKNLLFKIKKITNHDFRITLSLGEQSFKTYKEWHLAGAQRYLLRIETSNKILYNKIHPNNSAHLFEKRFECLKIIKGVGYQTGTGVMIGLPFQTLEDLANDLLFMKQFETDMVGMGPYLEHSGTPLHKAEEVLLTQGERFKLTLRMISILRLLMPQVNIAATTALQSIEHDGREQALKAGANVLMPNLTPAKYRQNYQLYDNKQCIENDGKECIHCISMKAELCENEIDYDDYGDSKIYISRKKINNE